MAATKHDSNTPQVLAFGELLWDCFPNGKVLGGAPANFAYRLQSLQVETRVVSRVGSDELGSVALAELKRGGVDVSQVQVDTAFPTGTVAITLSSSGDASYVINPGAAYDHIEITPELLALAKTAKIFYFGSLIQRHIDSRATLYTLLEAADGAHKILDLNLRKACYSGETVVASLDRADVLKLNHEEVPIVAQLADLPGTTPAHFAQAVIEKYGLSACLITRAEHGVYARSAQGECIEEEGYVVPVVDTVGSGDAFTAGFVAAGLRGDPFVECCRYGNYLGALVAKQKGAMATIDPKDLSSRTLPLRPCADAAASSSIG